MNDRSSPQRVHLASARDDDDESEVLVYLDVSLGILRLRSAREPCETFDPPPLLPRVTQGVWRHRAGGCYLVLGVAHDDRGGEPRVVYVRLYERPGFPVTVRRISVFTDSDVDGPRFEWIGTSEPQDEDSMGA